MITDWNRLPQGIIQAPSTDVFRAGVWTWFFTCTVVCLFNFNCKYFDCLDWLTHMLLTVSAKSADYPRRSRSELKVVTGTTRDTRLL
jgi:hypothetical protein